MEIGDLSLAESEAAVALWEEAGLTRPWNDPRSDIRLALAGPDSTILAGRIEGRLIATAMVGWDGHRGVPRTVENRRAALLALSR
jgi:hypothetical protein